MIRIARVKGRKDFNDIDISDFHWRPKALCAGLDTARYFNQPKGLTLEGILDTCKECPVRQNCLYESFLYGYDGIWGGSVPEQRNAIVRVMYEGDISDLTFEVCEDLIKVIDSIGHTKSQALADVINILNN